MTDVDEDRLELLERQLAERVTARVQPALFRLYAVVGTIVLALLGFVSWDIVADIKREIKEEVTGAIDKEIGEKRREISERVTETRFLAGRASELIRRVDEQLDAFEPQAENLSSTIEQVRNLNVTSQDLIAIYAAEIEPLSASVESLSVQLRALAEQVDELGRVSSSEAAVGSVGEQSYRQLSTAVQSVIAGTRETEDRLEQARDRSTVFIHFAGGSRTRAEALSATLKEAGYTVPGEERLKLASGKHEVRYFHDEDALAAAQLAADVNEGFQQVGSPLPIDVTDRSFTAYAGKKPRVGVLELWLEIP